MEHSAVDSALGYYYQGRYALLVLLRAGDAGAVIIEGDDDIVLEGTERKLFQLKHSRDNTPAPLSLASVQFWKTLKVWIDSQDTSSALVLVTCADFKADDPLMNLGFANCSRELNAVLAAVTMEGERVCRERVHALATGSRGRHDDRIAAVEAFLDLERDQRAQLLRRINIFTCSPVVTDLGREVSAFYSGWISPEIRGAFVNKLLEWWDSRVCRSLTGELPRLISRQEVYAQQQTIRNGLDGTELPDEFSDRSPNDLSAGLGRKMERQIDYVDGGPRRKHEAALARWRARSQRNAWLDQDLSLAPRLTQFDNQLIARWRERFDPMSDDLAEATTVEVNRRGRDLLDWSRLQARQEITLPRASAQADYLVPGSYQELADGELVGWHRDWEELLKSEEST